MKLTLRKLINQFLAWGESTLAPATVASYRHQLDRWLVMTKNKQVSRLRRIHLTTWAKTWHEYQAVIRCFNWAVHEAGLLRKNPFAGMRMPCRAQRQRILSPQEMAKFLRRARRPGRAFLLAMRETFARPQEIRLACWDDLHPEDPEVPIEQALACGSALLVLREFKDRKRRRDSTRPRILLVSARLGRQLLRLRRAVQPSGPIWRNTRGEAWTKNAVRCLMRRLRRRLQVKPDKFGEQVVAYTFRHSRATLAASKGIVDRVLADVLGHVETRTTARYQHLQVGHLREALSRIQRSNSANSTGV